MPVRDEKTEGWWITVNQELGLQVCWHPFGNKPQNDDEEKREIRIDYICELYSEGMNIIDSCIRAGCTSTAFYGWFHNSPSVTFKFNNARKRLEIVLSEIGKMAAFKLVDDPRYFQAYKFYMKAKFNWDDKEGTNILLANLQPKKEEIKDVPVYRVIERNPNKLLEPTTDGNSDHGRSGTGA